MIRFPTLLNWKLAFEDLFEVILDIRPLFHRIGWNTVECEIP